MTHHLNTSDLLKEFGGSAYNNLNNLINHADGTGEIDISSISQYVTIQQLPDYISAESGKISLLTLNCQSINAKFDQIYALLHALNSDHSLKFSIILIQETWVSGIDPDVSCYQLPGYQSFALGASCSSKGGLLCYVLDSITASIKLKIDNSKIFECLFLELEGLATTPILIGNIYRPPRFNNNDKSIANFIKEFNPFLSNFVREYDNIILAGDFNINLLKLHERQKYSEFLNLMMSNGFVPKITYPTRYARKSASLLDQIYVKTKYTGSNNETSLSGILYSAISDHFAAFTTINFRNLDKTPKYVVITKQDEHAMKAFKNAISSANLISKIDNNLHQNPNTTYQIIESELTKAKEKYLPSKTVRFNKYKHKGKNWITTGILKSIHVRDKLYAKYRSYRISDPLYTIHKSTYNNYNKLLNKMIKTAKCKHYHNEFDKYKDNIKKSWQTINEILNRDRKATHSPSHIYVNNSKITNKQMMADRFNMYFASIGESLADKIPEPNKSFDKYLQKRILTSFSFHTLEQKDVEKIIRNFKPKTSSGSDGISMKIIKLIMIPILPALTILINQSLVTGIFPDKMKIARILPLIKKANSFQIDNFRPISLLSSLSKILEKCVFEQVYAYFEEKRLFYCSQYGYRKIHSTEYACLELVDKLMTDLDKGETPICFFLDLSKAFDTINHSILLSKLKYYGLDNNSLQWFESYLSNRHQYVEIDNVRSGIKPLLTGVPQGSILGPLLFIIYMNDINLVSKKFEAILYADDTSLSSIIKLFRNGNTSMSINNELLLIYDWLNANKLSLNISKTKYMVFRYPQRSASTIPDLNIYINEHRVEKVSTFDFLGLTINETLTWKDHIHKTCSKISKVIGIMSRCKKFLPSSVLLKIYNALIISRINYGILCWGFENKRIYKLQKKAIRLICNEKYLAHTDPLFFKLNTLKVNDIYKRHCLKFFFNHENGKLPFHFKNYIFRNNSGHTHNTRHRYAFQALASNRVSSDKILRQLLPKILNNIPECIRSCVYTHSLQAVKNRFKSYALSAYQVDCTIVDCYVCNAS